MSRSSWGQVGSGWVGLDQGGGVVMFSDMYTGMCPGSGHIGLDCIRLGWFGLGLVGLG